MTKQTNSSTQPASGSALTATLVFPATHPEGRNYIEAAHEREETVIAATSERNSELSDEIAGMVYFPYVYESNFRDYFLSFVSTRNITRIYAPVAAVHSWLSRFIVENKLSVQLIGESPIKREMIRFTKIMNKVAEFRPFIDACADKAQDLSDLEIGAIFRTAENIYGESNDHKIAAMIAIFSDVPTGDVVEIGSLAGKSAAVLILLAKRYSIGNVLAIDPWQSSASRQEDSPDVVKVDMVDAWNYDTLSQNFIINTLPIGLGSFNYLRMESELAFDSYKKCRNITNKIFGSTKYQGHIAVIHIDGNHDYAKVRLDCQLWLPLLAPNGWLILDDYIWTHGDGPHRIGNDLLIDSKENIKRAFVCGKAMFVQFM